MLRTTNKKEVNYTFKSVTDFKRLLDNSSSKPSFNDVLTRERFSFFGTHTWAEFEEYLEEGNKEITADMRKNTKYYIDKFEQMVSYDSSYNFDVVGEFFDIGAVMVGEPEAWIKEVKVEDDKFITLDIQGIYADGTDLDVVRENGSKMFAIASVLEQQGFLVRINMHYGSKGSGGRNTKFNTVIEVKDFDGVLDYKKFGILLGTPFFRRGILRLMEIEYGSDVVSNFGYPSYSVDGEVRLDSASDVEKLEKRLMMEED